jgi:hypothetical protein
MTVLQNKTLQQTRRGVEHAQGRPIVINVRLAAERRCSADSPRMANGLRRVLTILAALTAVLLPTAGGAEAFAVLLGFASQDYRERYQTFYVASLDGSAPVFLTAPDLVVPHSGELWEARVIRRTAGRREKIEENTFWLGRLGASPSLGPIDWGGCIESAAGGSREDVDSLFLSPRYVGLRRSIFSDCGAQPGGSSWLEMVRFSESTALDMSEVLGPEARSAVVNGAATAFKFPGLGRDCLELTEPDDWALARNRGILDVYEDTQDLPAVSEVELVEMMEHTQRSRGTWHILTQLTPTFGYCGDRSWEFSPDIPVPPDLASHASLPFPFSDLVKRFPSTRDAAASPCASVVAVIGEDLKIVGLTPSGQIGPVVAQHPCSREDCSRLVMAEWLCDEELPRWHSALVEALR